MKNCIGFDIGNHAIHIAVQKKDELARGVCVRIPEDLVKNGVVVSYEAMADFLKHLRREYKFHTRNAALVLPAAHCYCRRFYVTAKTREQLMFNLPYGFKDFITDDKSNYFFDCAVLGASPRGEGLPPELDVFAAASRKSVIVEYISAFSRAGFKLKTIIPEEFAYINLLRRYNGEAHRHGILDIGHNAVKLFLFNGTLFESVRIIDYGCNALDGIVAEHFGVDTYMAATYRESDHGGANELERCYAVYNAMAIEVLKAVNFYRFNGGGTLEHLHCCGGGAHNAALMDTLKNTLPVPLTGMEEMSAGAEGEIDFPLIAAAAGAAMQ